MAHSDDNFFVNLYRTFWHVFFLRLFLINTIYFFFLSIWTPCKKLTEKTIYSDNGIKNGPMKVINNNNNNNVMKRPWFVCDEAGNESADSSSSSSLLICSFRQENERILMAVLTEELFSPLFTSIHLSHLLKKQNKDKNIYILDLGLQ